MSTPVKFCPDCQQDKPLLDFRLKTDKRNGKQYPYTYCKACDTQRKAAWYAKQRELKAIGQHRSLFANQPCNGCYRAARCVTDPIECAAFNEWAERGSFTPAFVGMLARVGVAA